MKNNIIICKRKIWKLIIKGTNSMKKTLANMEFESMYKLKTQNQVQQNLTLGARRPTKRIIPSPNDMRKQVA
jgi:hypothetical protein